ncbi:MAG: cytochrome b/b6 domain-containing protein [Deltaproteobacteria bacterium]|nr:cytochrome b/b6 domain-containing protein [Deltaproteobacteria bacterium]
MRAILLTLGLLACAAAQAADPAPTNADCLQCHEVQKPGETDNAGKLGLTAAGYAASVHKDLACLDCHQGYGAPGPHELPALTDAAEAKLVGKLDSARTLDGKPAVGAARAYLACGTCHAGVPEDVQASAHGRWLQKDQVAAGATCAACHGTPHDVKPDPAATDKAATRAYRAALSKRCEACHGDAKFAKAMGLKDDIAVNWQDSIHGRLVSLGSERAPLCWDCHAGQVGKAGHKSIAGGKVPESAVFGTAPAMKKDDARVKTCAQCHPASNPSFAGLIAHKPFQDAGAVPHIVHIAFSYLTTLTLLFFAFHVLVDFIYELRRRSQKKKEGHHHDPDAEKMVVRFDIHQRIQHWLMLSGVILLGLTGWPLRGAGAGAVDMAQRIESGQKFMALMGGPHGAGLLHRFAAVLIMLSGLYHLFYLGALAKKKALPFSMLPMPHDAIQIRDNILFMLGLKKERPRFERFNYLEKFDYWAVFWGIVMMVGSGFIFWFPAQIANWVPTWLISSALIVHGEEATLAILFLFVVHFYNVHLKPSIFPMNWAWITGQTSVEFMKDEHPAEYEKTIGKKP